MKKILSTIIVFVLALTIFSACGKQETQANYSLAEIIDQLYTGVDVPVNETIELDESNFNYYAFIPYEEGLSAVASDALVNITPHSVVVIKTSSTDTKELAKKVFENADPNKWLCVSADSTKVLYSDHYVILVMSFEDVVNEIKNNFFDMDLKDGAMYEYTG